MNERIKELTEQCWEQRPHDPSWFNAEKFAELIVKECLRRIEGCNLITTMPIEGPTEFQKGYDKAIQKVASQVRLHFGVK